jgi:hypothetical protein
LARESLSREGVDGRGIVGKIPATVLADTSESAIDVEFIEESRRLRLVGLFPFKQLTVGYFINSVLRMGFDFRL